MATFDGSTKTKTRVALGRDAFQPNMGSLVGTEFQVCAKVLGTRDELVHGNITLRFLANEDTFLRGNQTESISGDRVLAIGGSEEERVDGGRTTKVIGQLTETYVAGQLTTCYGPFNRTDVLVTWECSGSMSITGGDLYEFKLFDGACTAFSQSNTLAKLDTCGVSTSYTVYGLDVKSYQTEVEMINGIATLKTNEVNGFTNLLSGIIMGASGTTTYLRALESDVGPLLSPPLALGCPPWD